MAKNLLLFQVAVLAFAGTEARMKAIWDKNLTGGKAKIIPVEENYSLLDELANIMADNEIADKFVLVQANAFPTGKISLSELSRPLIYRSIEGRDYPSSRLPVKLDKDKLGTLLQSVESASQFDANEFIGEATIGQGFRVAAGHSFGNLIFQVVNPTVCQNKVIEAFIKKRFIAAANPLAWNAISGVIDKYLAE
jgi:hypothetical protein